MNEYWLLGFFIFLLSIALFLAYFPLRKQAKKGLILSFPLLCAVLVFAYGYWGSWPQWKAYMEQQQHQQELKKALAAIKSPDELIEKLKSRLSNDPASARGWYLLGRLYASQNRWREASNAFAKAHKFQPQDEASTVNYAQSLWQLNQNRCNDRIRGLFLQLLDNNPQQPDALAMLAMDAYQTEHYKQAVVYWQGLLTLTPPNSKESLMIRKAIAKAQNKS